MQQKFYKYSTKMATFKAEIYAHQKKADGTYNIKIRVTHKMKKKYIATPWFVSKEDLTRSLKLKNQIYIDMIDEVLRRYRDTCNRAGERLNDMTVEEIVELVTAKKETSFDLNFVEYTREYAEMLRLSGRVGTAANYDTAINSLVEYAGRENVSINEITVKFLNGWISWIQKRPTVGGRKKGDRAPSLYLSQIRAMHNRAKKEFNDEERGVIQIPYSPFSKIDIPKPKPTRKRALTMAQIRRIASIERPNVAINIRFNLARDVFMLSFMLIGMNAADLYDAPASAFDGERITYKRKKTRTRRADEALISVKVEPEAMPLVEKYRDPKGEKLFKFHRMYSESGNFNAALNKGLKQIGAILNIEDLEFYAARHSWATIANNKAGVDKYAVHEALNHVDPEMKVTDIYIEPDWSKNDQANRKVLDLLKIDPSPFKKPKRGNRLR